MARLSSLIVLLLLPALLIAACTQAPTPAVPVPTLAALDSGPTATISPLPLPTRDPASDALWTHEADLQSTLTAMQATQTALAAQPSPVPTDCGALAWWNYTGGPAIDFMGELMVAGVIATNIEAKPESEREIGEWQFVSAYADSLDAIRNDIAARDYPLCIKTARDSLLRALGDYRSYLLGRALALTERGSARYNAETVAADLVTARRSMSTAARQIQETTGQDTSMLLNDRLDDPVPAAGSA